MTENWSNETEASTLATFASQYSIFDPSGETRTVSFRKRLSVTLLTFDSDAESYVIMSAVLVVAQPTSSAAQNAVSGNVFITLTFAIFSPLLWQQSFSYVLNFITSEPVQGTTR
jgi:hypothetical protein